MLLRIAIDINDVIRDNLSQFITYYKKGIDNEFDIKREDVTSFELTDIFPFRDREAYNRFKYEDYPYELYGRAEVMDKLLPYKLNDWIQNTMRDFEEENIPEILFFSPMEIGITIQSTYAFLSKIGCRIREMHFPINSYTMWDRCDVMITANPNLLQNVPENKTIIKINAPYNKDIDIKLNFDSFIDLMQDENDTLIKIINDKQNE